MGWLAFAHLVLPRAHHAVAGLGPRLRVQDATRSLEPGSKKPGAGLFARGGGGRQNPHPLRRRQNPAAGGIKEMMTTGTKQRRQPA